MLREYTSRESKIANLTVQYLNTNFLDVEFLCFILNTVSPMTPSIHPNLYIYIPLGVLWCISTYIFVRIAHTKIPKQIAIKQSMDQVLQNTLELRKFLTVKEKFLKS